MVMKSTVPVQLTFTHVNFSALTLKGLAGPGVCDPRSSGREPSAAFLKRFWGRVC